MAMLDPRQRRRQGMAASAPGLARRTGRALLFQFRQDGGLVFGAVVQEQLTLLGTEHFTPGAEDGKRPATPSPPGSPNSVFVSTPNDVDTNTLQFLLNSASAYACPAVGQ